MQGLQANGVLSGGFQILEQWQPTSCKRPGESSSQEQRGSSDQAWPASMALRHRAEP